MMKRFGIFAAFWVMAMLVYGCYGANKSITSDQQLSDRQLQQYQAVQPVPFFDWSMDRAALEAIYTAKNEQRQTYAVVTSQGTGAVIWTCPSVSYPIPADTQLTNPQQLTAVSQSGAGWIEGVVGQMEPNGVYSSAATDATYVLCIRPDGKISPVYTEQKVSLFPFPVKVVDGVITDAGGASTIEVDLTRPGSVPIVPASPAP